MGEKMLWSLLNTMGSELQSKQTSCLLHEHFSCEQLSIEEEKEASNVK